MAAADGNVRRLLRAAASAAALLSAPLPLAAQGAEAYRSLLERSPHYWFYQARHLEALAGENRAAEARAFLDQVRTRPGQGGRHLLLSGLWHMLREERAAARQAWNAAIPLVLGEYSYLEDLYRRFNLNQDAADLLRRIHGVDAIDAQALATRGFARDHGDRPARHPQPVREERRQCLVRPTLARRRCNADLQRIPMGPHDFRAFGAGLRVHGNEHAARRRFQPDRQHRSVQDSQRGIPLRTPSRTISATLSTRMATSGDRSKRPTGGSTRWIGRRIGRHSCVTGDANGE